MKFHSIIAGCILVFAASTAAAQVLQPPARPFRPLFGGGAPPDPTRTHQELTLSSNVLGGYDDSLTSPAATNAFRPGASGYTGFGDTTLRYFFGKDTRAIEVSGRGYMNSYRNVGIGPRYGGSETFRAHTTLGRRTSLQVDQNFRADPFFSIGSFGAFNGTAGSESPDTDPSNGIGNSRSWTTNASASINRRWTRRSTMDFTYGYNQQTFAEGAGGSDSREHSVSTSFNRTLGRTTTLHAAYRRSDSELIPPSPAAPLSVVNDTGDFGFTYARNLSRTRQFSVAASGGATHVDTTNAVTSAPLLYWTPSARGRVRYDVGRSWNVAADYSRAVSVLQGLSPEPFTTHVGLISTGGYVGQHMEAVLAAGYSNGLAGQSQEGVPGELKAYTGTAQLRFYLWHGWSSIVSFSHYQHRLNSTASQSLGAPLEMDRNTVRIGFSWSLPLIGALSGSPVGQAVGGGN